MSDFQSARHRKFALFAAMMIIAALLVKMGVNGFYMEEPRRALVGLEMELNDNLLVPTQMGEFYYKKPPFFNWVLLGFFHLFGYNEWAGRLVTALSWLGMGLITFWFLRKYHSRDLGIYGAFTFLISADIFFVTSNLAEIDVFYSFLTYTSILCIYHFHKQGKYLLLFLSVYGLGAIGTLCKGLPSPVFIAASLGIFFLYRKEFKKLFSLPHFLGIGLYLLLVGGYFFAYSRYNDPIGFWEGLGGQATDRTVIKTGWMPLVQHLVTFPVEILIWTLPATAFLPFLLIRGAGKYLWKQDAIKFLLILFMANIFVYWISPGTRSRYIIMLLPMVTVPATALYLKYRDKIPVADRILKGLTLFLAILLVVPVAAPFLPQLALYHEHIFRGSMLTGVLALGLLVGRILKPSPPLLWFVVLVALARIWFGVIALPIRAEVSDHSRYKADALKVAEIVKDQPLYIWQHKTDGEISLASVFYLERERRKVLRMKYERNCSDFFLAHRREVKDFAREVYYEFDFRLDHFLLFRFKDCE